MNMQRVDLQLNMTCNQNCVFCATATTDKYFLSTREAKLMIDRAIANDDPELFAFSGGEPTLRNDLPELVDYIKNRYPRVRLELMTNAARLQYRPYADKLRAVDRFCISLHGSTEAMNDLCTRTPGSFRHTLAGADAVYEMGLGNFGFYFVATSINFQEMEAFVRMIYERYGNNPTVTFAYPYYSGNVCDHPELMPKLSDYMPLLWKAQEFCQEKSISMSLGSCGLMPLCLAGKLSSLILKINQDFNQNTVNTHSREGKQEYLVTQDGYQQDNFQRGKSCAGCKLQDKCPGVWNSYARIYGTDELFAL